MTPEIFLGGKVVLHAGDSRAVLKSLAASSIDSIVTDPPYALVSIVNRYGKTRSNMHEPAGTKPHGSPQYQRLAKGFMGKAWDTGETAFAATFWAECLRVLKPGGHVVAFSGTRTYHRMACAIEDAGFEVRDMLSWLYGSGFPKSHDVSKGIDKLKDWTLIERLSEEIKRARAESGLSLKEIGAATLKATGNQYGAWYHRGGHMFFETGRSLPSRPEWDQLRHVLQISDEFVVVYEAAEREIIKKDIRFRNSDSWEANGKGMLGAGEQDFSITAPATASALQWQGWGTALKPACEPICFGRKPLIGTVAANVLAHGTGAINVDGCRIESEQWSASGILTGGASVHDYGDGLNNAGRGGSHSLGRWPANVLHDGSAEVLAGFPESGPGPGNVHTAKDNAGGVFGGGRMGVENIFKDSGSAARFFYTSKADSDDRLGSKHPTVKPLDLMQWLCRLVTPPGGTILDPFAGTGTTGEAAFREGFNAVLIEREDEYLNDIRRRMRLVLGGPDERARESIKARQGAALPDHGPLFAVSEGVWE